MTPTYNDGQGNEQSNSSQLDVKINDVLNEGDLGQEIINPLLSYSGMEQTRFQCYQSSIAYNQLALIPTAYFSLEICQ